MGIKASFRREIARLPSAIAEMVGVGRLADLTVAIVERYEEFAKLKRKGEGWASATLKLAPWLRLLRCRTAREPVDSTAANLCNRGLFS